MNEDKMLRTLRAVRISIIGACVLVIAVLAAYIGAGFSKLMNYQKAAAAIPYAAYGIQIPPDFTRSFKYASKSGFHGDKCTAVKFDTNGSEAIFADFSDGTDAGAESLMSFVIRTADVPEELRPDYSLSYKWKIFERVDEKNDDSLVVIWFPEQEAVYFGESII